MGWKSLAGLGARVMAVVVLDCKKIIRLGATRGYRPFGADVFCDCETSSPSGMCGIVLRSIGRLLDVCWIIGGRQTTRTSPKHKYGSWGIMVLDDCNIPGLKMVVRDKPHATRRNCTRNYRVDVYRDSVCDRFIFGQNSPVRLIQYSQMFKQWFKSNIEKMSGRVSAVASNGIRDMHFAGHRFDSTQKPFARTVLFFHALMATVLQIARSRSSDDSGKACRSFLEWVDTEKCVQLSMEADFGDENMVLTRLVDYEGFPTESLIYELAAFKDRIKILFTGDNPLCMTTGFTCHMLQILAVPFVVHLPGLQKQLGGEIPPETIGRCQARMQNLVVLTLSTLKAEFPAFETLQAWGAFNVQSDDSVTDPSIVYGQLLQIKNTFNIAADMDDIIAQHAHFHPIAKRIAVTEGIGSQDAWHKAMTLASRTHNTRLTHPKNAILEFVVRLCASGGSSSGCEQTFTKQVGAGGQYLEALSDSHLDDRTEMFDIENADLPELCKMARDEWAAVYGQTRASGGNRQPRMDKGVPRMPTGRLTEKLWIRKRRLEVGLATSDAKKKGLWVIIRSSQS